MRKDDVLWIGGLLAVASLLMARAKLTALLRPSQRIRKDAVGDGSFGSGRVGHRHQGVDLLVIEGEPIYSPVDGIFDRRAVPYPTAPEWKGVVLKGEGYHVKVFYMTPVDFTPGQPVKRGQLIGHAQAISDKYGGAPMKDHIHVEVRKMDGTLLDPATVLSVA